MKPYLLVACVLACKSDAKEVVPAAPKPALGVVAEIRGKATLVPGTGRFALRTEAGWYESTGGALVDKPAVAAAITREVDTLGGVVDIFLGTTPIVVGESQLGGGHREVNVRITPARMPLELDGLVTKIATARDGREGWAYTHELTKHVAIAGVPAPPFERLAPVPESASPVSRRLCEVPQVQDVAASDRFVHALVVECNTDAPLRIASFGDPPSERRLPSRRTLGTTFEQLAVARDGTATLVAVRDRKLAILRGETATTYDSITRVLAAVVADDGAVWALVLDGAGKPAVVRDGTPIAIDHVPTALAFDDTLGVVVLATGINAMWLLAERPGASITITR